MIHVEAVKNDLRSRGYAYFSDIEVDDLEDFLKSLGQVIQMTNVQVNEKSKALVTSARGLDFHTDHHKADIVAWYCFKQTSKGGDSIFLDTEVVLSKFTKAEKQILSSIMLYEHKVFDNDEDSYPLISEKNNKFRCYYSFWLVNKDLQEPQKSLLKKFQDVISETEPRAILLKPKDVLIFDNGRILHGRKPIEGDKDRLLKRYWVSCPAFLFY